MSGQAESYGEALAEEVVRKDKLKAVLRNRSFGISSEIALALTVFSCGLTFLQKQSGGTNWILSASLAASWGLAVCALSRCRVLGKKVDALIALSEMDR